MAFVVVVHPVRDGGERGFGVGQRLYANVVDRYRPGFVQSRLGQHVAHRGHVTGPVRHRGGNRRAQPVPAEFPPQRQHRNHGAGAILLAMPLFQPIPQLIVAGGPATGLAPLRQWFRSGERTRFLARHIKVMLEIKHMLTAAMAAFVAGNQVASVPDLDVQRMNTRFHPAARAGRH